MSLGRVGERDSCGGSSSHRAVHSWSSIFGNLDSKLVGRAVDGANCINNVAGGILIWPTTIHGRDRQRSAHSAGERDAERRTAVCCGLTTCVPQRLVAGGWAVVRLTKNDNAHPAGDYSESEQKCEQHSSTRWGGSAFLLLCARGRILPGARFLMA